MMLSRTGWDITPLSVAGQTEEGRRAPWGCAAGAPYRGTASPPPPPLEWLYMRRNAMGSCLRSRRTYAYQHVLVWSACCPAPVGRNPFSAVLGFNPDMPLGTGRESSSR